ncbi:MAG: hypothetical protein ACREJC_18945 [Tepidisphaeraceae bacterium]
MPGETDLHKTLKKEACRWLLRMGYRCIAAEVRVPSVGIIDAVGTGLFRPGVNHLHLPRQLPQACFIECKASRADFLRDQTPDGQFELCLSERRERLTRRGRRRASLRNTVGLGKFLTCIMHPVANLHYVLAPCGIVQKKDLPHRWGLLTYGDGGVNVVVRATWQDAARIEFLDSAIARTLTADIFRADDRAMNSVNHRLLVQQRELAERIRAIRPRWVLATGDEREAQPAAVVGE